MQTVFRVPYRAACTDEGDDLTPSSICPRPRRSHKKSRYGCQNCKTRRVKCDEDKKNGCSSCKRYGIKCNFLSEGTDKYTERDAKNSIISPYAYTPLTLSPVSSTPGSPSLISRQLPVVSFLYDHPTDLAPVSLTFPYFKNFTCATVTTTAAINIFEASLLAIAHERPYLMHAMLGIAAAHLSRMGKMEQNSDQFLYFRKTESHHWQTAIRLYRQELKNEPTPDHTDALITTCMLLGCHSLYLWDTNDASFVDAPEYQRQSRLRWLFIPMGFTTVLQHVSPYVSRSAWLSLFVTSTPAERGWTINVKEKNGIYTAFLELCDVDQDVGFSENPYTEVLKHLFALLQIEVLSMQHLGQLMAFMGRFDSTFRALLIVRDSRALLIFLYWFVLLDQLDLWWTKSRAVQEAGAIIRFLQYDNDPGIQALLQAPRLAFEGR